VPRVRRKTKAELQAEHDAFLRRMGYRKNPKNTRVNSFPDYKAGMRETAPTSDRVVAIDYGSKLTPEQKLATSANYTIGQAYNKGGLVVLSKREAADAATGKRRV